MSVQEYANQGHCLLQKFSSRHTFAPIDLTFFTPGINI